MPRGKKGSYGLAEDGNGDLVAVRSDGPGDSLPPVSGVQTPDWRQTAAIETLKQIDARTDGWLRWIPGAEGKICYVKYKFTRGRWAGHYVMWQGVSGDVVTNLCGIGHKLEQVDAGELRPAYDTWYDPR